MQCAILTIGNEVVEGHVLNTNATYFANKLNEVGVNVRKILTITDDKKEIIKAINELKEFDLVIVSGGLGPTNDDITKECIAQALEIKLEMNEAKLKYLVEYFESKGLEYDSINDKQALFSELDTIIYNDNGSADAYYFTKDKTSYCVLPGPPRENRPLFDEYIKTLDPDKLYEANLFIYGLGETQSEGLVAHIYNKYPLVYIGSYLQEYGLIYRVKSSDINSLNECVKELKDAFKDYYLGNYIDPISVLVKKLIKNNLSISFAESCTGGLVAATIIKYKGVSSIMNESLVTYSNESKIKYLNVEPAIIEQYGVVSKECAQAMAIGLSNQTNSCINISITGIAGPDGGTAIKPVGLVHFAISYQNKIYHYSEIFIGDRNTIRTRASHYILFELLRLL